MVGVVIVGESPASQPATSSALADRSRRFPDTAMGATNQAKPPKPRMAFIRPFTTYVFNPLSRHVAGHLPTFGILEYPGRKSGKQYRTPLNCFRDGEDWIFALTYSSDVQWVKN